MNNKNLVILIISLFVAAIITAMLSKEGLFSVHTSLALASVTGFLIGSMIWPLMHLLNRLEQQRKAELEELIDTKVKKLTQKTSKKVKDAPTK